MCLVVGVALGVAVGGRIGALGADPGPGPSTATVPDIVPGSVSQRLRDAFYGNGGNVQVCEVATAITCSRTRMSETARSYDEISRKLEPTEMASLTMVHVHVGHLVVVGEFGPAVGVAIVRVGAGGPLDGRFLDWVNPDRQGIVYIDLGEPPAGTYLMAVGVMAWYGPTRLIQIGVD
jgi:hypothetical protein